ncbi:ICEBs1 excisionase [Bacillus licheniformis]|uniref:transcriptional regulator n=1 Tax=Bacillus licheniformis TaxID=1402 RepID=UPI0011A477A1|nr:transcriptional regulator [Bacillus licheniformis]TWK08624.1 ICEBs1 excisionase [Bacillus licheniformis]
MAQVKQHEFYKVEDVMRILDVKQTKAYSIIRKLNKELEAQGKIVVAGRVSKKYFDERIV